MNLRFAAVLAATLACLGSAQAVEPRVLGSRNSGILHLGFTADGTAVVVDGLARFSLDGASTSWELPISVWRGKSTTTPDVLGLAVAADGAMAVGLRYFRMGLFGNKFVYQAALVRPGREPEWVLLPGELKDGVASLAFSPDSGLLAASTFSDDKRVWVWDVRALEVVRKIDLKIESYGNPWDARFSPDGARLAVAIEGEVRLFDTRTWEETGRMRSPDSVGGFRTVAFSPDGRTIAAGQWDGPIRLFDAASGGLKTTLSGHKSGANRVAFSPDGELLASGSDDKTARLWDLSSGKERAVLASHTKDVNAVGFSPDGAKLATGGSDGKVLLYEVKDIPEGSFVAPTPSLPAALSLAVSFLEPSGDGYLDAGEQGVLKVETSNAGPGEAHGVTLSIELEAPSGVTMERRVALGSLAPNAKSSKEVSVYASEDASAGKASLSVQATEANGFDSAASKVEFSVRPLRVPKLEVAGVSLAGGDVVKANQVTKVTVQVRNTGEGPARSVRAALSVGADVFPAGDREASLGDIPAGGTAKASFEFFVNARFKGKTLPIYLALSEAGGKAGVEARSLGLALGEAPAAATLVVRTKEDAPAPAAALAESVDAPPQSATPADPNAFAVVIGIERYREESIPAVDFAARDARTFADYLTKSMGFDQRNVVLLVNAKADRTDIDKYVGKWLRNRVKPDSRVVVYFAGHGAPNPQTGEGYILPYSGDPAYTEETAYPVRKLYEALSSLPAAEVTVVLDACFSGRGDRSVLAKGARPLVNVKAADAGSNTVVLSAAGADQISTLHPEAEHGMLTYFLLKALRGEADKDRDGRVTTREIYDFVLPSVEREARKLNVDQTPSLSPAPGALGKKAESVWIRLK
ncbi:MAG: caspase family protein [Elusimicrobia bacterium]|nr:caspase family protein [Elusimicrobiota bacterium]